MATLTHGMTTVNGVSLEWINAPDWTNYYDRLAIIEASATHAETAEELAALRLQWQETKAVINRSTACSRCYGAASTFKPFMHVMDGKCFRCGGTGLEPTQ